VASVKDLATDLHKIEAWLAGDDGLNNSTKIMNILIEAIHVGRSDICQLIFNSGLLDNSKIALISKDAIETACLSGQLSMVQLIVSQCHPSTQQLYTALANACLNGHVKIVGWLLDEMKLSYSDSVKWLLATASARGDIDTVKLLAAQNEITSTKAMSQALRAAFYQGRVTVVDWLITYTTANVSSCGGLGFATGPMTSLTAACYSSHPDIVLTLLQCVTSHTVNIQCGKYND
jgi:hypothetical protein